MPIAKNSFGVSIIMNARVFKNSSLETLSGSCLERKSVRKQLKKKCTASPIQSIREQLRLNQKQINKKKAIKERTMSARTKSKIRKKIIAFSQVQKKLSFVTLTFCNKVEDNIAVKIMGNFLNNVKKLSTDFQYLWVAEKQTKNKEFENNIHFHLITNKYWDIQKWWKYWLDLQAKSGISPTDENYKPSSAFDVRQIKSNNIKSICNYLTKYVTKNSSKFKCQVWNCSKKISRLYTDFYSGMGFIENLEKLQQENLLGGDIKTFKQDYCDVKLIPLNQSTLPFYNRIEKENLKNWKNYESTGK